MGAETSVAWVTVFVDGLLFVMSMVALVVSGLVLYIGVVRQRVRGTDILLLVLMALMDSAMGGAWMVFLVGKWATGYRLLDSGAWCQVQGAISIGALEASSDCAAVLALVRYLAIVWRVPIRRWWDGVSVVLVAASVGCAATSAVYGMSVVMPVGSYCEPITLQKTPFAAFYGGWLLCRIVVIPVVIVACYVGIVVHYRRLKASLGCQLYDDCPKPSRQRPLDEIDCAIRRLLAVCAAYAVAFLPSVVANITQVVTGAANENIYFDAVIVVSIVSIIVINPLFAVLVHHETNQDLRTILFGSDSEIPLSPRPSQ